MARHLSLPQMVKALVLVSTLGAAPAVFARGDMLQPDELPTHTISAKPTNDSGMFIGAGLTFGQAGTTESGASSGVAAFGQIEPGFQASTGDWSRFEVSLEVLAGSVNYRQADDDTVGGKVTYKGLYGALAKVGYGYSLGHDIFGVLKAGVGPVFATYNVDLANGAGTAKSDSLSGLAWTLGWEMVAPINRALDFTVGISFTQMDFDVSSVKLGGTSYKVDRTMIANIPAADIGLRVRL